MGFKMSEYKLIKELGLIVQELKNGAYIVNADDLEALLQKAIRVYGKKPTDGYCSGVVSLRDFPDPEDTHSGLLLNYKPTEKPKPVSREELRKLVESEYPSAFENERMLKRILKNGVE